MPRDLLGHGTTAHHYALPIEPKGRLVITLRCRAIAPGEFTGNVMAFVDIAHGKFVAQNLRIVIGQRPSA